MPRNQRVVTLRHRPLSRSERPLPPELNEYVVLAVDLRERGVLDEIEEKLRLARRGGYVGLDLVTTLLAYYSSGPAYPSLDKFCGEVRRLYGGKLAAVAGRCATPSQPSMSRMGESVSVQQVEGFQEWLLIDTLKVGELAQHESVLHRDCLGQPWHVFSYDMTVSVLRQRALPEGDDLPAPKRDAEDFASAGYPGRKRGEVQVARGTLQHRGTRLVHWLSLASGNGNVRKDLEGAVSHLERWTKSIDAEPSQCIVVVDGAHGGWPQLDVLVPSPVHGVFRLAYYEPLQDPDLMCELNQREWTRVRDSRSGPERWATEFGALDRKGHRVRLVVTRFRTDDDARHGSGTTIDGWHYEVFGTDLTPEGWPAAEVATLYYARCGQENDFAREDAMLQLDHIISYNLGGQFLGNVVGLWLWNLRIVSGVDAVGGLAPVSTTQAERKVVTAVVENGADSQAGRQSSTRQSDSSASSSDDGIVNSTTDVPAQEQAPVADSHLNPERAPTREELRSWVAKELPSLLSGASLGQKDGWHYDPEARCLRCPATRPLHLHGLRPAHHGDGIEIRLRAGRRDCRECTQRAGCTSSTQPNFVKEVSFCAHVATSGHLVVSPATQVAAAPSVRSALLMPPEQATAAGPFEMRQPLLIAAELMRASQSEARAMLIQIQLTLGPPPPQAPRYYAMSDARRQRRRKTWSERLAWNALPTGSRVIIEVAGASRHASIDNAA